MSYDLKQKRIAILATDGFEQSELESPLEALRSSGATVDVVSPKGAGSKIRGWADGDWGDEVEVDVGVTEANVSDYDGLVLPGGVINPDQLRRDADAVRFVQGFFAEHKPVAAICHGPWMVVEAGAAEGRRMTSFASIRTDLENAGAEWVDEEVVVDEGLVTSRSPDDLEAFNGKMVEEFFEGRHAGQTL